MKRNIGKHQSGIVLLSTLVFLVLILSLLRISLSSSQLDQRKAGINFELQNARESAQLALRTAESYILEGGVDGNGNPNIVQAEIPACKTDSESKACRSAVLGKAYTFWKSYKSGSQTGVFLADQSVCEDEGKPKPSWQCVDWNNGSEITNAYHLTYHAQNPVWQPIVVKTPGAATTTDVASRYIVEVLNPGSKDILLRITALGFGQGDGGASRMTNVLLQATYLFASGGR